MNGRVLVDTSAFYALVSPTDEFHQRATTLYENLIDQRVELWTTSYILVESIALVQRRLGFIVLERFIASIQETFNIFWISQENHWKAWELLQARQRRSLSFVDCATVIMSKALDTRLFAFDEDFAGEGIEVLM